MQLQVNKSSLKEMNQSVPPPQPPRVPTPTPPQPPRAPTPTVPRPPTQPPRQTSVTFSEGATKTHVGSSPKKASPKRKTAIVKSTQLPTRRSNRARKLHELSLHTPVFSTYFPPPSFYVVFFFPQIRLFFLWWWW